MRGVYIKDDKGKEICLSKEVEVITAFMDISKYVYELTYRIEIKGNELINFIKGKNLRVDTSIINNDVAYEVSTYDW